MNSEGFRYDVNEWTAGKVLARQARSLGSKTFVHLMDGGTLSYAEADSMANRVANALRALEIGKGDRVAVLLPNGLEICHLWLGAARIGAVHVAVNTQYRGVFLSHVMASCGATVAVCHGDYLARLVEIAEDLPALRTVIIVGDAPDIESANPHFELLGFEEVLPADDRPVETRVSYRDTATIMYTSGTTGPAKGVLMPHAHDYLFGLGMVDNLALTANDVYYITLPLFHANGLFMQLYGTMIVGGTAVIRDRFSASKWIHDIRTFGATVTNTLGVMNEFILNQPESPGDRDHRLRAVAVAPNTPELADSLVRRFGVEHVIGVYGMTEANIPLHTALGISKPGSCGREYSRYFEVRVVNPDSDAFVAAGEIGEIVVRPKQPFGFMSGYDGMPDKTAEASRNFWFHTGDAATCDEDGYFYFVDRTKDCIRRRGENISSYQVESVLTSHPDVAEAAAVAVKSEIAGGEDEVKAVVVREAGRELGPDALAEYCARHMPGFAVPRYIEFADALPKTPTEKVQKHLLREQGVTKDTWDRMA